MPHTADRAEPGPGQESVWDYPRPPRVEPSSRRVELWFAGHKVADSTRALRVLETSHPPTWYIPAEDVRTDLLEVARLNTYCEWKGYAAYFDLVSGPARSVQAAWTYLQPNPRYAELRDHVAFYPSRVDEARVDGERVRAQEGDFYGGWITADVVGPFKGPPGTRGW